MAVTATRRAHWPAVATWGLWGLGVSIIGSGPPRPTPAIRCWPSAGRCPGGPADRLLQITDSTAALVVLVSLLAGAVSLLLRCRRARGTERLQLRWVAPAAVPAGVAAALVVVGTVTGTEALWLWATAAYVVVLPLAIGAAILRYRPYDLDRIFSRTLAWTLLTPVLGLGYAAVVLLLGRLLPESSSLAVATASLWLRPAPRR
jgi:hypothetical protein